jgi:hypothetical protein
MSLQQQVAIAIHLCLRSDSMPTNTNSVSLACSKSFRSTVGLILLSLIALPFVGCSEGGSGTGPLVSSLSTPTEETVPAEAEGGEENQTTASTQNEAEDSEALANEDFANIADPDEQEDPTISLTSTPTGVTAQLTWDESTDPNVQGYFIHYGKQSPGEYGSCSYEQSQRVGPPPATVTDLDPNTPYFFAISAFGESESESETPCSNEVLVVTPATPQT